MTRKKFKVKSGGSVVVNKGDKKAAKKTAKKLSTKDKGKDNVSKS